jgi:3-deoxy-D-manno-octulosonate 8-phosphate phosphatase (KDO 8-P phosphatase)
MSDGAVGSQRVPPHRELSQELAGAIRLVVLDVDGVLTDGGVYLGELPGGEVLEMKRFDIQDGLGIKLLQWAGVEVVVVSGRMSRATEIRARELGIEERHQDGDAQKVRILQRLLMERNLDWREVAMLGDDLPDLAVLQRVGLPAVVSNATEEARRLAVWQAGKRGGHGAVREFCEALLKARGDWDEQVEAYVRARSGSPPGGSEVP